MKAFGYIAAIIGGAVAGATAALLLAPEKVRTHVPRYKTL